MKGLRTLMFNGLGVVGVAGLTWATGVDWTQYVSPTMAVVIVALANMGLRVITTTPVGQAK